MNENIKKVNEVLEDFYKLFFKTEDMALKRGIKCLTHTELHLIEAIGQDSLTTLSTFSINSPSLGCTILFSIFLIIS